jgi:hypothetical protein
MIISSTFVLALLALPNLAVAAKQELVAPTPMPCTCYCRNVDFDHPSSRPECYLRLKKSKTPEQCALDCAKAGQDGHYRTGICWNTYDLESCQRASGCTGELC